MHKYEIEKIYILDKKLKIPYLRCNCEYKIELNYLIVSFLLRGILYINKNTKLLLLRIND